MLKNHAIQKLSIVFCILLLATILTNTGYAQNEETSVELYQVGYMQVKPGMEVEFEQLVKSALPYLKAQGINQMFVSKTASFGESNKYVIFTLLDNPARLDAELSQPQTSIPVEFIPVMSTIERTVVGGRDFMIVTKPDLSILPKDGYDLKLGVMVTVDVTPGREQDFEKNAKEVVAVVGKTNVKGVLASRVALGGNQNEYLITVLYDSFAELLANGPVLEKALADAQLASVTGIVEHQENEVLVFVPELGIVPEAE